MTTSWWTERFNENLVTFQAEAKRLGDSQLPKQVRRFFRAQEASQAEEMAEIRRRPRSLNDATGPATR